MTETVRINRESLGKLLVKAGLADTKIAGMNITDVFFDVLKTQILAGNDIAIPGFGKFSKFQRLNGTFKPKFTPFTEFRQAIKA